MNNEKVKDLIWSIIAIIVPYLLIQIIPFQKLNIEDRFLLEFLGELTGSILVIILIILLKHLDMFKVDKEGFEKGWTAGIPLILIIISLIIGCIKKTNIITVPADDIYLFIGTMFLVGFYEETIMRGFLQRSLHNLIGENSTNKVRIAVVISGIVFGSVHMINAIVIGFLPALTQAIGVVFIGMMIGAIYFRTNKNLWYVIILHSLNDAFGLMVSGQLNGVPTETILEVTNNFSLVEILIPSIFYGSITMFLLRKNKIKPLLK